MKPRMGGGTGGRLTKMPVEHAVDAARGKWGGGGAGFGGEGGV